MRIGQLAKEVGVATSAIRFYEEVGLIPEPERTASGYRDYSPSIIDRLTFIRAGQTVGLTLAELRDVLAIRDGGTPPCHHVTKLIQTHLSDVDDRIDDLLQVRQDLTELAGAAAKLDPELCSPESICHILSQPG
ncbi:hypoxia response transcriptional regulator [soil metagenome]